MVLSFSKATIMLNGQINGAKRDIILKITERVMSRLNNNMVIVTEIEGFPYFYFVDFLAHFKSLKFPSQNFEESCGNHLETFARYPLPAGPKVSSWLSSHCLLATLRLQGCLPATLRLQDYLPTTLSISHLSMASNKLRNTSLPHANRPKVPTGSSLKRSGSDESSIGRNLKRPSIELSQIENDIDNQDVIFRPRRSLANLPDNVDEESEYKTTYVVGTYYSGHQGVLVFCIDDGVTRLPLECVSYFYAPFEANQ
ncbi:hypothetical protein Cgig2_019738 [Carnegiea gigantea]|uniref:Uncharacterized protein n=1 Tax=Carnegiea gigantea TaxID=171969 RepID=A0A9Q1KMZ1_9CARY|nr:hypothetical protein Cgig2_019738 [Carnegiea gigantea]